MLQNHAIRNLRFGNENSFCSFAHCLQPVVDKNAT